MVFPTPTSSAMSSRTGSQAEGKHERHQLVRSGTHGDATEGPEGRSALPEQESAGLPQQVTLWASATVLGSGGGKDEGETRSEGML
jgi:hypothetical protein